LRRGIEQPAQGRGPGGQPRPFSQQPYPAGRQQGPSPPERPRRWHTHPTLARVGPLVRSPKVDAPSRVLAGQAGTAEARRKSARGAAGPSGSAGTPPGSTGGDHGSASAAGDPTPRRVGGCASRVVGGKAFRAPCDRCGFGRFLLFLGGCIGLEWQKCGCGGLRSDAAPSPGAAAGRLACRGIDNRHIVHCDRQR